MITLTHLYALLCIGLGFPSADNFHEAVPGRLYRANTLQPETLAAHVDEHHIQAIINLRGEQPEQEWWQLEASVAKQQNIPLYNLPMKSFAYPQPEHVAELLQLFGSCPGPLLVHCRAGVDRAGIVSGLWLLEREGATVEQAINQLSFLNYGHIGWLCGQMVSFLQLWGTLRQNYSPDEALREYTKLYESLDLGSVDKLLTRQQPMQQVLARVGVIVAALKNRSYVEAS